MYPSDFADRRSAPNRTRTAVCRGLVGIGIFCLVAARLGVAAEFEFVVLGDTTYEVPVDTPVYKELIRTINDVKPAFSIHVGDTKGFGNCGESFQAGQRALFNTFNHPVVYAFGNNEWSDCWKDNRDNADPTEILAMMRNVFYADAVSLGALKMPLVRQSDQGKFVEYQENVRWVRDEILFLTLNMVGERNNQELRDPKLWNEFREREQANLDWVHTSFSAALEHRHRAVVVAFHSNPFVEHVRYENGPFEAVLTAIMAFAEDFEGIVLVIHGHHHAFVVDRPLLQWSDEAQTIRYDNLYRLQTFGWPEMKAVRVSVDTSKPWIFGFEPLYAENSLSPGFDQP